MKVKDIQPRQCFFLGGSWYVRVPTESELWEGQHEPWVRCFDLKACREHHIMQDVDVTLQVGMKVGMMLLTAEDILTRKFPRMFGEWTDCGISIGIGWLPLVEKLCKDIEAVMGENALRVKQVKEKFGGLRIYTEAWEKDEGVTATISNQVYALITAAEDKSFTICEDCGEPGETGSMMGGDSPNWIRTTCEECREINMIRTRSQV